MASEPSKELARIEEHPRHLSSVERSMQIAPEEIDVLAKKLAPKWPKDLNSNSARELALIALTYGLHPMMGEIIPYQGAPYITMAGRFRVADDHPQYDGMELP